MRCIALWQPWASLWLTDRKVHETRHWGTSHRGWLAVHAAKKIEKNFNGDPISDILVADYGTDWAETLPRGAIIGAVNLTDCRQMRYTAPAHQDDMECGNWEDERFAWRRADVIKLLEPIPYRGLQGIFTLPDGISQQILDPARAA